MIAVPATVGTRRASPGLHGATGWGLLAAAPSSMMLGVTSYMSTDLSPFPLLWVIPLSLYLLSFILVFSKWPTVWTETPHTVFFIIGIITRKKCHAAIAFKR